MPFQTLHIYRLVYFDLNKKNEVFYKLFWLEHSCGILLQNKMCNRSMNVGVKALARGPAQAQSARARGGGFTAPSHSHISAKKKLHHPEPFALNA